MDNCWHYIEQPIHTLAWSGVALTADNLVVLMLGVNITEILKSSRPATAISRIICLDEAHSMAHQFLLQCFFLKCRFLPPRALLVCCCFFLFLLDPGETRKMIKRPKLCLSVCVCTFFHGPLSSRTC